jgi:predicted RND superfamily exporter protein
MMDRIREEMATYKDIGKAVGRAISTTGLAISFTALTLICGIAMWIVLSDLRFQADAARLLSVMVVLNAMCAMILVPSWALAFKPKFIMDVAKRDALSLNTPVADTVNKKIAVA